MQQKKRKRLMLLIGCLVLSMILAGCESGTKEKSESLQDFFFYSVLDRLDRQNSIYARLETIVESSFSSEDRSVQSEQFQYLCQGANCFIRDELTNPWYDQMQEEQETLYSVVKGLTGACAKYELDQLWLGDLSDEELSKLGIVFGDLAECCDRSEAGSLAYQVSIQEYEGNSYQEALVWTKDCIAALEELCH